MRRAKRLRALILLGALLVLALLAAGPHGLLHDHGHGAAEPDAPDCQLCACVALEVADAPRVERPTRAAPRTHTPGDRPALRTPRGAQASRAPPAGA